MKMFIASVVLKPNTSGAGADAWYSVIYERSHLLVDFVKMNA